MRLQRLLFLPVLVSATESPGLPFVINTWSGVFTTATDAGHAVLVANTNATTAALDAVQAGCSACEVAQCDGTVGFGGSPDEACETTLDALLMDGTTMNAGAVAALRRVRHAIAVARAVLDHTAHTMLAGDQATAFAVENGFVEEDLSTLTSREACRTWRDDARCQPNFRVDVVPNATTSCGPYKPLPEHASFLSRPPSSHDTVSMIAISSTGAMAAGTSTNGASHKVPGRVGDGPIVGSGAYVDGEVGGCGATGDGDVMMRFLPCYQAVENLRRGMDPTAAAEDAVLRMVARFPGLHSGLVVVDTHGRHGAAASGWTFTYAFRGGEMPAAQAVTVPPLHAKNERLMPAHAMHAHSRQKRL